MKKDRDALAAHIQQIGDAAYDGDDIDSDPVDLTGITVNRPSAPARVYSLRLTSSEVTALERAAQSAGVPASALARRFITERLAADQEGSPASIAAELADLSRKVAALA